MKSLVSHVLNFKSWIKLIYDIVGMCNFVINEFNLTFEVQNIGNEAFQNASFGNASFPNEALGYSCLWARYYTVLYHRALELQAVKVESCDLPYKHDLFFVISTLTAHNSRTTGNFVAQTH